MRLWTWAVIIGGVIAVAIAWQVAATSGPRYDSEGLPTAPVGVTYVTNVPEYRLAYPGARILSVTDQGEIRYGGWLQVNTISPATSTVRSEAPARQQQVLAWYSQWLTRHGWTRCTQCAPLVAPRRWRFILRVAFGASFRSILARRSLARIQICRASLLLLLSRQRTSSGHIRLIWYRGGVHSTG